MAILKIRDADGRIYEVPSLQGPKGEKGDKGDKGDTPKKGVDYYTEAEKTELVAAVVSALPNQDGSANTEKVSAKVENNILYVTKEVIA